MNLSSLNSQFIFNLPINFVSKEAKEKYKPLLRKNHIPYDDVIDYLNSTILEVSFPSIAFDNPEQTFYHGKEISWKGSKNVYDNFQKELDITFDSVNSHLNYMIFLDILINEYLNTDSQYSENLSITFLDKHGDAIYVALFRSVNFKSLSDLRLQYSDSIADQKTFSIGFIYNYLDIKFLLDGDDIITDSPVKL